METFIIQFPVVITTKLFKNPQKKKKKMLNINAPLNLIAVLMLMIFEVSNILEKCIERKQWRF